MDKLAQERGIFNKLREKANVTGRILESLNPEFHDMMEKLRSTDEKIREHAINAKDLIRSSQSLVRRRDYLSAAVNLSAFHERSRYVAAELERFIKGVDLKHYQFLLDQFDDEQKEQLFGYDPTSELNLDESSTDDVDHVSDVIITAAIKKQAGLSDWWFKITDPIADLAHNVTTQRGIAMRALEKKFSISFLKQLKTSSNIMVTRANQFMQFLLRTFKKLAVALAKRNVDQYVSAAKDYISRFAKFHELFVKFYQGSIVPLKQQYDTIMEQKRVQEEEKSKSLEEGAEYKRQKQQEGTWMKPPTVDIEHPGTQPPYEQFYEPSTPGGPPSVELPGAKPAPTVSPAIKQKQWPPASFEFTKSNPKPFSEKLEDFTYDEQLQPFNLVRRRNLSFIGKIEKYANENNMKDLVVEILQFSTELEDTSPEESMKLLAIAEGIVEDYKTAGIWDWLKDPEDKPMATEKPKQEERLSPLL